MVPNSRKLPPPSSSSTEYQRVGNGHRKRSLSAAAPALYNRPEASPQKPNSKTLFSRLRSGSQIQQSENRLGPPPPSNSYSSHSASSIPSSRSAAFDVDLNGLPAIEPDQKVKRKPLFSENNGLNSSAHTEFRQEDKPLSDRQPLLPPAHAGLAFNATAPQPYSQANAAVTSNDAVSRKASQKGAKGGGGFGRFFRKLSRASEDDDLLDDAPKVRPISMSPSGHIASRTPNPYNIPLAPAPPPPQNYRHSALPNFPAAAGSAVYPPLYENAQQQQPSSTERITPYHQQHHVSMQIPNSATFPKPVTNRYEDNNNTLHRNLSPPSIKPSATYPRLAREEEDYHNHHVSSREKKHERHSAESKSSTAWLSLYSTFASDSENALDKDSYSKEDLTHIVSQNVQRRPQAARIASTPPSGNESSSVTDSASIDSYNTTDTALDSNEYSEDDEDARQMLSNLTIDHGTTFTTTTTTTMDSIQEEDRCSAGSSDRVDEDEDVFVDATGFSQDDIKREQSESKLSKRLSGGHYGSAGGLMLATAPTLETSKQQKRRSRPPPEDIAKAMLNWKRQSGGSNKRLSGINKWNNFIDNRESTSTVVDLRVKQQGDDEEEDDENMRELSLPDKETLREQAAETLMGKSSGSNNSSALPATSQPPETTSSHQRTPSINQLSFAFSKSLDAAWNDPNPEIAKVFDPRLSMGPNVDHEQEPKHTEEDAKDAARRLWQEDETLCPRERIAEWLGSGKPLNSDALVHYMDYFEFGRMRLDSAFRKLCSKLYFKAEAQQIDRILEVFARRYWSCNADSIYKSADVVYAVVYSVLLLNTDLHVAQGNYNRMTRYEFIKNTIAAIHDQPSVSNEIEKGSDVFSKAWEAELESHLKELYTSVKQYQILQPLSSRSNSRDSIEKRGSLLASKRVVGLKRSVGSIIRRSARESMLLAEDVQQQPRTSTSSTSRPSSPQPKSPRRRSVSSIGSAASFGFGGRSSSLSPTYQPMINFMDTHGNVLFRNQPPYIKEGVVIRKHLLEKANQKAKHREWKECLLVVDRGELKMYALHHASESERKSMIRASSASFASLGDSLAQSSNDSHHETSSFGGVTSKNNTNKWVSHSQLLGTIPMSHTLSNALPPPGYNRHRPHVFAIQQPDGGVYLFQAPSAEQVNEWVATCNYWAARESKEPLPGGVSNMEYGWGSCLNDVILDLDAVENNAHTTGDYLQDPDSVTIYDWQPPVPPSVPSTLNEKEQYEALLKHLQNLNEEINHHRELKKKIIVKFPSKSNNHAKAMANWDAKSKYLLHDIIKYQNYCDILEKSIQQQEEEAAAAAKTEDSTAGTTTTTTIDTTIDLSYSASRVDLMKEIGEELQLAF